MSRLFFFIQEAFRALRRNAAPSLAAIVTTAVTVVLLGVLIPIFQTAQAKSDEVRGELNFQVGVFADATHSELIETKQDLEAIPHVARVEFVTKAEALAELKESLGKKKSEDLGLAQLRTNPLPANFRITPDDAANLTSVKRVVFPDGPEGEAAA